MRDTIKIFIENYIEHIEEDNFSHIYKHCVLEAGLSGYEIGLFTEAMIKAGIDPLNSMNIIPPDYLYESNIKSFDIPSHIRSIGMSAFDCCDNLKHIIFPKNVEFIDDYAFYGCDQLTSIDIQNPDCNISAIGFPAFVPVVRYSGTLDQWRDFITKNKFEFLECNRLELADRTIFLYSWKKIKE